MTGFSPEEGPAAGPLGAEQTDANAADLRAGIAGLASLVTGSLGLDELLGRVATFAFTHERRSPEEVAKFLAERGIAVWHGNYYALEVMRRLGLEESGGAVRVGIVHYNTPEEVDRLLSALAEL